MTRLAFLSFALAVFATAGSVVGSARLATPRWRVRLAFVALLGTLLAAASLLAAVLLPEVLVVRSFGEIWAACTAAFAAIWDSPLGRWPSVAAGAVLAVMLGRFVWALVAGIRATRRARVAGEPRQVLPGGRAVYVLPVDLTAAYSVPGLRGQVVLTRGLLKALDRREQRAVLLHEEAHLRLGHHLLLSLAKAAEAALRPFPPSRWALAALEQACEEAADEYAAAALGDAVPVATGLSKAALAGIRGPVGVLSLGSGPDVPARVRRLLDVPTVPRWMSVACVVTLVGLLGLVTATQVIAGFAIVAAAHHLIGVGAAATCPFIR